MAAKCKGYKFAVECCAFNDESAETDLETISQTISVSLVADLFGIPAEKVAAAVLKVRNKSDNWIDIGYE